MLFRSLENRGGARAVARVLAGDTDAAMMILHAPFRAAELDRLLAEDAIDLVPFQSKRVAAAAVQQRAPYALKEIELGPSGWFAARRRYQTTCSPLGVVVNENADPRLSESVAQAMLYGTADFGREGILRTVQDTVLDFAARLYTMATDLGQRAIDLVVGGEEPATERDDGAASRPFRLDGRPSGPCGDGGM